MRRLVAMLLMIAFAWGGVVTSIHAGTLCDDSTVAVSVAHDGSNADDQTTDAPQKHHCAPACHVSAALPALLWVEPAPSTVSESPRLSVTASVGHVGAVPTPPPSIA